MTEERMRYLLKDAVDLHIHTSPSISKRALDVGGMTQEALKYGYRGFIAKDHYFASTPATIIANKYIADGKEAAFATMVMNNSVGGFNIKAVSTAVEMGTAYISMPTVSALEHQNFNKRPGVVPFSGGGKSPVVEAGIPFLDENGELDPRCVKILEFLVKHHPNVTFATGHGSAAEVEACIKKALEIGIKKIHVNHPYFITDADMDTMARWTGWGAFIELNACLILHESTTGHVVVDNAMFKEIIRRCGVKQCLLVSDLGQFGNVWPTNGFADLMEKAITDIGCTEDEVFTMAKQNPAYMLNL